jgi:glycosyltransferase involved in cell wall biosynthesis
VKVSVITPTWRRHDLLLDRCIPSVRAQTWPDVEHVIVSDGPDLALALKLQAQYPQVVYRQLPEHVDGTVDYGSRARNDALTLACGDLVAYLDDDNAFRPKHLQVLVDAMLVSGADFGWSKMRRHPHGDEIGAPSPCYGGLDSSILVHRRGLPDTHGLWPLPHELAGDKHAPDWGVVARWLAAGATWVHVDEVTVDYYFPGA